MLSFHQAVADDFSSVNNLILQQAHSDVGLVEEIGHYLIDAGGKRLRPLLVLLVANAVSYQGTEHHTLATIIEFIHTATLLHDDVVDTSNLRRGRATANAKWGNPPSVLVGDFLYSRAFQLMVKIGRMDIMAILANTTNTISEGEVQQLINAGDSNLTEEDYSIVIYKKTAVLFQAACETAAVLALHQGRCDDQQRQQLKAYGFHLGMAFQLVDDALDYIGDSDSLGKNAGDDLSEGKLTLPLIHAMKLGSAEQRNKIITAVNDNSVSPDTLRQIVSIIRETGADEYTRNIADKHVHQAKTAVTGLPDSTFKQAMLDLADFALNRNH